MPQKYIVVFKQHVSADQIDKFADDVNNNGGEVGHRYGSVLNVIHHFSPLILGVTAQQGFSASIPDEYLSSLQSLVGDDIDYIEPDSVVTTQS
ncbi:protease propeptide/inhibitor [Infundibulicybe gibba]|nr:protease propeptide/inhibitor [Infundibulicybe gibba]